MFKQAKIIPVFKKGNPKNMLNYRPICLLPTLSKMLEKVVYTRLHSFILLRKLNNYGVRGVSLNWFESYLSNRSQIVEYAGVASSNQVNISSSVPQGFIFAPLLFIIYVNDFNNCVEFSSNISFTDDTNVCTADNQLQTIYEKGNQELKNIDNWMIANKLSINTNKTNCVLFQTPKSQLIKTTNNLHLKSRNDIVEKVSSTGFWGVIINENLSWKNHMENK